MTTNVIASQTSYSGVSRYSYSYSYSNAAPTTAPIFDHDRLDDYRLSLEYVASSFAVAKDLNGCHRHARDQWLRVASSIPLNILEGNGKRSVKDGNRFLDIACGSAIECVSGCARRNEPAW
ncbi:four helix bundle protein [Novipirellula caenicola]|uniref:four helix bundle protein n=1 Tax=Novipirellula caenicola TaxID=1536901 RepID=UPI0031E5DA06